MPCRKMIYIIASIPFIVVFYIHVSALNKTKNCKFRHFFLQMLIGPVFVFSFFGPVFFGLYINDSRFTDGICLYTTSIVFLCNMGKFFYELIKHGKEMKNKK